MRSVGACIPDLLKVSDCCVYRPDGGGGGRRSESLAFGGPFQPPPARRRSNWGESCGCLSCAPPTFLRSSNQQQPSTMFEARIAQGNLLKKARS